MLMFNLGFRFLHLLYVSSQYLSFQEGASSGSKGSQNYVSGPPDTSLRGHLELG